jgi:DNA-binding MarR family transcriptional regulator
MIDKSSNASRLVEKLRAKGLVFRETAITDRRAVEIGITDKGLALLEQLDEVENKFFKDIKKLTNEEAQTLSNLLDKMRE